MKVKVCAKYKNQQTTVFRQSLVRRFKGLDEIEFVIPKTDATRPGSADFVSIVGENNVGKSSVLDALRLACTGTGFTSADVDHFPAQDEENGPIEVEMEFDELTDRDREMQAIRKHVHDDKFWVKLQWNSSGKAFEGFAFGRSYSFSPEPASSKKTDIRESGSEWCELLDLFEKRNNKKYLKSAASYNSLRELAIEVKSPVAVPGKIEKQKNPGGLKSNLATVLPRIIHVPAIRETKDELETAKSKSTIRSIVNLLFERELSGHVVLKAYEQSAKRVKGLFEGELKHEFVQRLEHQITVKLTRLIDIEAKLGFTPPSVTEDLAQKVWLRVRDGEIETLPEHQGHGAQRTLILALLEHLAEVERKYHEQEEDSPRPPLLLLIEEPEIYLHPEMCRKMRDVLLQISRKSTAQVICTTHSPIFLDLADRHDGIVILRRNEKGKCQVIQRGEDLFEGQSDKEQRQRLRMILNFDPSVNEVFFTNEVCIVEGDCEIASVDAIATKLAEMDMINWDQYLLKKRRLSIVNARGKWTILPFQKVLNAFDISHRVVHDVDKANSPQKANEEILKLLGNDGNRRLTHSPNFEQQIFGQEWKKDKPWKATKKILSMSKIDTGLLKFFEFVLQTKVQELNEALPVPPTFQEKKVDAPTKLLKKRNTREDLKKITPEELEQMIEITEETTVLLTLAAGPTLVPDIEFDGELPSVSGAKTRLIGTIRGNSMSDTLLDGDRVVIETMEDVKLLPIHDNRKPIDIVDFREHVNSGDIYLISMNEDISFGEYTLKRVKLHEDEGGSGWTCLISADNPETPWGDRGRRIVVETDHVHFAARLVGIVQET